LMAVCRSIRCRLIGANAQRLVSLLSPCLQRRAPRLHLVAGRPPFAALPLVSSRGLRPLARAPPPFLGFFRWCKPLDQGTALPPHCSFGPRGRTPRPKTGGRALGRGQLHSLWAARGSFLFLSGATGAHQIDDQSPWGRPDHGSNDRYSIPAAGSRSRSDSRVIRAGPVTASVQILHRIIPSVRFGVVCALASAGVGLICQSCNAGARCKSWLDASARGPIGGLAMASNESGVRFL
jgi:hypothetical protein